MIPQYKSFQPEIQVPGQAFIGCPCQKIIPISAIVVVTFSLTESNVSELPFDFEINGYGSALFLNFTGSELEFQSCFFSDVPEFRIGGRRAFLRVFCFHYFATFIYTNGNDYSSGFLTTIFDLRFMQYTSITQSASYSSASFTDSFEHIRIWITVRITLAAGFSGIAFA